MGFRFLFRCFNPPLREAAKPRRADPEAARSAFAASGLFRPFPPRNDGVGLWCHEDGSTAPRGHVFGYFSDGQLCAGIGSIPSFSKSLRSLSSSGFFAVSSLSPTKIELAPAMKQSV